MKKVIIFLIIIALSAFGFIYFKDGFSNQNAQLIYQGNTDNVPYSVTINLPDWQKVDTKGTEMQYTVKFTPLNDADKALGRELYVSFYNSTMNYYPESQYIAYIDIIRKKAEQKTKEPLDVDVRTNSTNNIIFNWKVKGIPYSEMNRYVRTQKGLYFIKFTQKKEGFTDDEKEAVGKILRSFKEQ